MDILFERILTVTAGPVWDCVMKTALCKVFILCSYCVFSLFDVYIDTNYKALSWMEFVKLGLISP